jgi:hypothetical protein
MQYEAEREDIILYKRKSKLNVQDEFLVELKKQSTFGEIKRRRLELNRAHEGEEEKIE